MHDMRLLCVQLSLILTRYSFQMSLFISKMGLDLIPRVDGEVVDADSSSVVELYKVVSYILLILGDYKSYILVYKNRV